MKFLTKGVATRKLKGNFKVGCGLESFLDMFTNRIFLSGVSAWFLAQFIKTLIQVFKSRRNLNRSLWVTLLWTTGGMPSSHSAVVTALTTAIAFRVGLQDPVFLASLFFSFLAIRDALGVRRAAGLQARLINQMAQDLNERLGFSYKPVKEINGHKAAEVTVGILLGFFLALAFNYL